MTRALPTSVAKLMTSRCRLSQKLRDGFLSLLVRAHAFVVGRFRRTLARVRSNLEFSGRQFVL